MAMMKTLVSMALVAGAIAASLTSAHAQRLAARSLTAFGVMNPGHERPGPPFVPLIASATLLPRIAGGTSI